MKKAILIFLVSIFNVSIGLAQDTIVFKTNKKIVGKVISIGKEKVTYIIPPDSTPKTIASFRLEYVKYSGGTKYDFSKNTAAQKTSENQFYLSADYGYSVPVATYKDAIVGPHFDLRATYYLDHHWGISVRGGADFNSTISSYTSSDYWGGYYIFNQYLAGLTYRTGGKPGFPFVDIIGLLGACTSSSPAYEEGGGYNPLIQNTPGSATGFAYYLGVTFTSSTDHFCSVTFGAGCLGTLFKYPNYVSTTTEYNPYTNITNTTKAQGPKSINLELIQMYVGINLRLKKAEK